MREWDATDEVDFPFARHVSQSTGRLRRVAFVKRKPERKISHFGCGLRAFAFNRVKHSTQRRHVRSRFEPDKCSTGSQGWAPRLQGLEANGQGICLFVFASGNVYPRQIGDRT